MKSRPFVVFVANYLPDNQESMYKVSILYEEIIKQEGFRTMVVRPVSRVGNLREIYPSWNKIVSYIDKYIIFPIELIIKSYCIGSIEKNVIYHIIDHSNAVYSFCLLRKSRLVTCHDTLAINSMLGKYKENRTSPSGKLLQKCILLGLKISTTIVCVSSNTKKDLECLLDKKKQRITTALQPLNRDFYRMKKTEALNKFTDLPMSSRKLLETRFILHVGGNQWYKNRKGVCAIYEEIDYLRTSLNQSKLTLIMAGQKPTYDLIEYVKANKNLKVIFLTRLNDEQINALYSLASVLLFPSIKEGFGWPIVEAMACGCPVITTGREPMTEAGGNAAVYIDPLDTKAAAKITNDVLEWNEAQKENCKKLGYDNVKRFSRRHFAHNYKKAYQNALKKQKNVT